MKKHKLVLLVVENNDYQAEQTVSAKETAQALDVDLQIIHTEHDAVMQGDQVLKLLYNPPETRPDGILFEPVGTPLGQPARLAASTGVAWVILNREVDYVSELRRQYQTPVFCVSTDHDKVGHIQGEQMARLLPNGGEAIFIQGPSDNKAAVRRTTGMQASKPSNIELRMFRGLWTEESAYESISSWLKLHIAKETHFGLVIAQNDAMAIGARRAFEEHTAGPEHDRWLGLPFIGCDGLPNSGQAYVHRGLLAATVVIPANAGQAIKALVAALRTGEQPPETILTNVDSYPPLTLLKPRQ